MKAQLIQDGIYALHADVHSDELFEGIWPINRGVSLNSYIVKGTKTALIDLVRDWEGAPDALQAELKSIGIGIGDIDYLVLNHLEPDHTGWLAEFKNENPKVEILATAKGLELVKSFYKIEDGLRAVQSGDTLDLGGGKVLLFEETPNVHWPETMMTFEKSSGVLFSCDAFGSFGALGDKIFDDEFSAEEHAEFEHECLRYYSNIVSSFSLFVKRAAQKLEGLDIKVVAPSHGIVWRSNPKRIIDRYLTYASYMDGPAEKEVCVIWGSMYGNTEKGLETVLAELEKEKLPYTIHRVPNDDVSYILADAYRSKGLVIAMPTYEYKMFPPMAYVLNIFERKHVWNRVALRIGSYGWVGGAKKEYEAAVAPLKWKSIESVEWAGSPDEGVLDALRKRSKELIKDVKAD